MTALLTVDNLVVDYGTGRPAVDGVSLTVASLEDDLLGFSIIPHTALATALTDRNAGDQVNVEVDMIMDVAIDYGLNNHPINLFGLGLLSRPFVLKLRNLGLSWCAWLM